MNKHIHLKALAFGAGLLLTPTLATAQNATVKVLSPATVVAKGAGVDVLVGVACEPPFLSSAQASISVTLAERVGKGIATGTGNSFSVPNPVTCDGSLQTFEFLVTSFTRYKPGLAVAQASAFVSDGVIFQSAQQPPIEIQFVNVNK